jgi:Holliday junction resolvasome RuvABC endonuclease subunit
MHPARVIGIDPSLGCTGWAITTGPETVVEGGIITPEGETLMERARSITDQLLAIIKPLGRPAIVVETPATQRKAWGGFKGQNPMSAAAYAFVVGVVVGRLEPYGEPLLTVAPDEWAPRIRGAGRAKDPYKTARVQYAAQLFNIKPEILGPKTVAGNVADALLLARWGWGQFNQRRPADG